MNQPPTLVGQIQEAADSLSSKGVVQPEVGVILGTGLGNLFVQQIEQPLVTDYQHIPNFPTATVEHHQGKLVYGTVHHKKIVAMQGRFHFYEGYSMKQITFPVRVMKALGVRHLLISNAAGNLNLQWKKGELMLVEDHINLLPDNPLRGQNDERLGPRFPDMSSPYSHTLNEKLRGIARKNGIALNEGVYVAVMGPNLETRAEYRFLGRIGADAVGMSTVPEVIVANHMGLSCCAVSVLTDDCDPDNLMPAKLDEIVAVARRAEPQLTALFTELIKAL